ncbi:MAG TPA: trypsin-like peptidase domain-containing protein, partial [Pirellulales bacterium]|nr:trypsin-like peptidase domain-containing protein [Pirellulales bacterium]
MSQVRIACPSCKAVLTLKTAIVPGMVLRCPQCRSEFGVRGPAQGGPPSFDDPLGMPMPAPPVGSGAYGPAPQSHLRQPPRRTLQPARPAPAAGSGDGNSMWLGIAIGGGLAIAGITLLAIIMMMGRSPAEPSVAATPLREETTAEALLVDSGSALESAPAVPAPVASSPMAGGAPGAMNPSPTGPMQTPSPVGPSSTGASSIAMTPPTAPPTAPAAVPVGSHPAANAATLLPSAPGGATTVNVPGSVNAPAASAGPSLAYRWKAGEEYGYAFSVKVHAEGISEESNGLTVLTLSNEATPPEFAAQARTGHATGSGFVLSSDGYVMTCAHVVEGSTKIEVVIGGQSYSAQVVVFDKTHDLAVVRAVAANLPVLPLADSDKVEMAQEVRTVGFPLSTVLGDSVKVTRGAIAGRVEDRKVFQIDGSINPGNSGGPVVNEMGQVVGVASSKLASEDIDGVGFAVPSNAVQTLLRAKGVPFQLAEGGTRLEGPELARRVTPAVALFKVEIGPGGFGIAKRQVLKYSGRLATKPSGAGGPRRGGAAIGPAQIEQGKLLVSELGEVIDSTGNAQLPCLLGSLGALAIEPLPSDGEKTWQTQRVTALTQIIGEEQTPNSRMPSRYRRKRGSGNPFAPRAQAVVVIPALEVSMYELEQTSSDRVRLKKKYVFTTLQKEGTPPVAQMTGEGTVTFNTQQGYPENMDFRATMVRSSGAISITVPVTLAWNRVDQRVLDESRARGAAAAKEASQRAAAAAKAAAPTAQDVDRMLRELKSASGASQKGVIVGRLARMAPLDSRRTQVAQSVEPLMRDPNVMLHDAAIRAMGVWGTKENVPALLSMLDQLDSGIRRATLEALGKIPDKRSAEA